MLPSYYYERKKRKKQKLLLSGMIALLLLIAIFLFFPKNTVTPVSEVVKQEKALILSKTATLKLTTLYECGHQRSRLFPLPEELEGKDQSETIQLRPDWKILRFEEEFLEAEETPDTVCDNHFLLKLQNNKIVVVKKNTPDEVVMEEKINPSILTNEDKEILSSGISVNSEYELLEILESFK